ncbi:MAG: hypothetical protein QOG67_3337 [Verrucomicrobiota bacterium]|jgi:hypothetical protein
MSRRTLLIVVGAIGAIVVANIFILAKWLPRRPDTSTKEPHAMAAAALAQASVPSASTANTSAINNPASAAQAPGGFAVERQVMSASGNVRIKYARDRKTKVRRILVEDAHHPEASSVIHESKNNAWVLLSPDDQWIAVDERTGPDGGGARLYHRNNGSSVRYDPAGDSGQDLQDAVWKTYLGAVHADANTSRRGVTIDATGWEKDSRKLNVSVAYLPTADKPDVPEPWGCTYDVASKHVEPNPDQPVTGPEVAAGSPAESGGKDSAFAHVGETTGDQAAEGDGDEDEGDTLPGEKFPTTREDQLTDADVNESSLEEVDYAINEMLARHGAEFKDAKTAREFSSFPWYESRPGVTYDQIEKEFSDLEKENFKVLSRCRDSKLAASQKKARPVRGAPVREESKGNQIIRGLREAFPGN